MIILLHTLSIFGIALSLLSCGNGKSASVLEREKLEAKGLIFLDSARSAMQNGDYEKARAYITTMRKECQRAINARTNGILLLDSIELTAAQDDLQMAGARLDSNDTQENREAFDECHNKVKFYHRKLQHDKAQNNPQ